MIIQLDKEENKKDKDDIVFLLTISRSLSRTMKSLRW